MIERITTTLANLPPAWMSRIVAGSGNLGQSEELKKLLGEPIPKIVNPNDLPRELKALFAAYGLLQRIRKKLAFLTRKRGKMILPAKNTISCVDEEENVYVGVDFLAAFKGEEDIIAGVMAHEWGHMISELPPGTDFSHLTWDDLFEIRREEEAAADAFAGRALQKMGYEVERMVMFLKNLEKLDKKLATHKYHPPEVRAEIVRQAFLAEARVAEAAKKLVFSPYSGYKNPNASQLIAIG